MTINEAVTRVNGLALGREVKIAIGKTAAEIVKLNQKQLYDKGQDMMGAALKPYAWPEYADMKLKMNPGGVTDLKLTGAFYASMYVDVGEDTFEVGSTDEKEKKLQAKYKKEIFGLSAESIDKYIDAMFPTLKEAIEKQTGLKMT